MNNQFLRIFGLLAFFGLTMFQTAQAQCGGFSGAVATISAPSCANLSGGSATVSTTGGTAPLNYVWQSTASATTSIATGINSPSGYTITGLPSGNTFITVTDANFCMIRLTTTLSSAASNPGVSFYSVSNPSCSNSNGTLGAQASGGTAPYTYLWNTGATAGFLTNRPAGTYTVTITDANGCRGIASRTLTATGASFSVSIQDTTPSCSNNQNLLRIVSGTPAFPWTTLWSNGSQISSAQYTAGQTASITVTDANGCTATNSLQVSNASNLQVTAIATNAGCTSASLGSATAQVSGGQTPYNYVWRNLSFGAQIGNAANISNLTNGAGYSVEVTDANGCSGIDTVFVQQNNGSIFVQIFDSTQNSCSTSRLLYTTMPYQNYIWSNGTTTSYAYYNVGQWAVVTVTNANGCQGVDSFYVQNTGGSLQVNATATNAGCASASLGSATAQVQGGQAPYSYMWSNGYSASNTATGLAVGIYTVQVTDANGCQGYDSVFVQNGGFSVSIMDTATTCTSSRMLLHNVNGAITYPATFVWNNGLGNQGGNAQSYNVGQTAILTVTDANGCTAIDSFMPSNGVLVTVTVSNVVCGVANSGYAIAQAWGNPMPFRYAWSNGFTSGDTLSNLTQGTYSVTVTNANGCTGTFGFNVQNGSNNFSVILYDSTANCNDSIRTIAIDSLPGMFNYLWSNGSQNAFSDYMVGDFAEVTVTNAAGCQAVGQYYVSPAAGNISFWGMTNNTSCGTTVNTGNISVYGSGLYQYVWSTGATTNNVSGMSSSSNIQSLAQGWYGLTVTDANGCANTADFYVDVDSSCYQLISGYAYLIQQQAPSNCQPNNNPCMFCEIAIDNGTTVDYVFTDNNGYYEYYANSAGAYNISFANTNMLSAHTVSCPSTSSISINVASGVNYANNNFFVYVAPVLELALYQYNVSNIVPGFQHIQFADICNYSDITANGTYTFNYPVGVQFSQYIAMAWNTASLASASVSHNSSTRTVTINFTGLPAYACFGYNLIFDADTTLTIGDTLCFTANVDMTNGTEPDLTNNSYAACLPVEASYDPNDKRVTNHSGGDQKRGTISVNQTDLHYVIRFQNTGTAPARRVIIRDDLAATLLQNTISNVVSSHPCQLQVIDGQLVATFLNLNLLPQSASEALSQGFISFNIQRQAGLPVGTRIDNTASIFFDYNSPIITNTAQTTIAQVVAVAETRAAEMSLQVMPNPFNGQLNVNYELTTDSKVRVSLINALGETVLQVANTTQTAGVQQLSINTQDLGAGVYYLMLETEAGRFAQKVIKQ